uniref:phage tail repeat domain-containing protein n=3 Tax=Pseudomonadota TaxID=1224 RepID=UPI00203B55DC
PTANSIEFRFADGTGGVASLNAGGTVWTSANFNPAGKADAGHTHTIANVSGLQGALDAKANSTSAQFTNLINIGGASDLSVQLNPTGG